MAVLVVIFVLVVALSVCFALLKWNEIRYSRRGLPPGTMGWPLFGETTDFIKQGPDFIKKQRARTCSWLPQSMLDILGEHNIVAAHGTVHSLQVDHGTESASIYETFKREFDKLVEGTLSLPINIPGTSYHHGFRGRKNVIRMLKGVMEKRRASSMTQDDMLGYLLRNEGSKYNLSDEEILDQVIIILYSGYETVSTTSMMAVKYLLDNPRALQQLREEHLAIRQRKNPEDPIDWNDYKSMNFTRAVIFETSRLATVVNGVLRKTTKEMELNGFVIPRGWRIYVYTREINYDPFLYPEPYTFNPWRWLDNSLESHNYCFIFGGGTRLCPGKELGILHSFWGFQLVTRGPKGGHA
ncbi:hypothetical protein AAG906_020398 [Vitis piasezkii]